MSTKYFIFIILFDLRLIMNAMPPLPQGDDTSLTQEDNNDNHSLISSSTSTRDSIRERTLVRERRKMALIQKYNGGQIHTQYSRSTMMSLNNAVRTVLIP